ANILAEHGMSSELISADRSQTDPGCQVIYEEIMESLPEPFKEKRAIEGKFYGELASLPLS
ncbi:hypothetical protein J7L81_05315, partial [Candidatus Aerophobetes bacterium]|nr:hypothetical protein [Candidatus Aerophobetes bacterium]